MMELSEVKQRLAERLKIDLQIDEEERASRPFITVGFDGECSEEDAERIESYGIELPETEFQIKNLKAELQTPCGDYSIEFEKFCEHYDVPCKPGSKDYSLFYREFIKAEVILLERLLERINGEYPEEDLYASPECIEAPEMTKKQVAQQKDNIEFAKRSAVARRITNNPQFEPFKSAVLTLTKKNPRLSNAEIARRVSVDIDLNRGVRTVEGYVAKILEGPV